MCYVRYSSVNTRRCVRKRKQRDLPEVYIAEEGLCDIGKLLRQQHIVKGSSALSRAAARCRGQQRVVEGSSVLSRAGAHDVRETTVVTVTLPNTTNATIGQKNIYSRNISLELRSLFPPSVFLGIGSVYRAIRHFRTSVT
jgi:hypothetical protein